jgi:integrase
MPISEVKARNAKPKSKPYKIADGDGLFLLVSPSGSKYWRMRYFFGGKEKLLALGVYPDVSLAEARERRIQARKVLANGNDPSDAKKAAKRIAAKNHTNTFETIAREWLEKMAHEWKPGHLRAKRSQLQRHIFKKLGNRPIVEITAPDVLETLRAVEAQGILDTTRRLRQIIGQVFMYAIVTGRAERNPVPDLQGALKTPIVEHYSFLTEAEMPEFLQNLEGYNGKLLTKLALRVLVLTFVRSIELRGAQWNEFNWDKAEWRIPAERMKMGELHIVPLSRQLITVLRELEALTGECKYVFVNSHNPAKYMSENTLLYALYRMGYHSRTTAHGFRSTASTILNEHGFRADVIERQLAHGERNKIRAAYNHAQYLPERREMMQWWADYLDEVAKKR